MERGTGTLGYRRPVQEGSANTRIPQIRKTLWVILLLNFAVAFAKLFAGIAINSAAMQADGFHSMFDGTSNIVGLVGMAFASRPADRDHPYGHSKFETYASAVIGAMLLFAAYRIGGEAIHSLIDRQASGPHVDLMSFTVMIGTLAVNLGVTMWERAVGKRLGSAILVADASHTGSDAIVSIGVIISLVLVKYFNMPLADPIVALLVTVAIIYAAWGVFKQASATLSDSARIPSAEICQVALEVPGVLGCHHARTRGLEAEVLVDLHVQVDPQLTVLQGHDIAENVERTICQRYEQVVDVLAHLEPFDDYQRAKTEQESREGLA